VSDFFEGVAYRFCMAAHILRRGRNNMYEEEIDLYYDRVLELERKLIEIKDRCLDD
jgi:hypothetical protein